MHTAVWRKTIYDQLINQSFLDISKNYTHMMRVHRKMFNDIFYSVSNNDF
jgi:fido (protein-threonine AMPylation protein)